LLAACPALFAGDPTSQVRRALDDLSRQGLKADVAGRSLALHQLEFSEVTVDGREPPQVLLHVEASGTWGAAALGYYGGERISFGGRYGRLAPPAVWLPKLDAVLIALAARDAALEARDAVALARLAGPENHDGAVTLPRILAALQPPAPDAGAVAAHPSLSVRIDGNRAQVSEIREGPGPRSAALVEIGDSWRFTTGLL
jgi:hypothetical protein